MWDATTMMQQPQLLEHKVNAMRNNKMVSIAAKNLVTMKLHASHLSFLLRHFEYPLREWRGCSRKD